jgi:predicted PhzF superfamily epimerase YddE/YHI9
MLYTLRDVLGDQWVARVFTADNGAHGNDVSVILTDELPPADLRQQLATAAPEPATVFVAGDRTTVRIHNRKLERQFAGHPLLGTAAVLRELGLAPTTLATSAGVVRVWTDHNQEWLHAPAGWSPNNRHRQVPTVAEVESLRGPPADEPVQVWSWLDESAGLVRARMFAPSQGKPEDEASGSASMVLAVALGRDLTVVHGQGSVIHARPRGAGVNLGGRCVVLD